MRTILNTRTNSSATTIAIRNPEWLKPNLRTETNSSCTKHPQRIDQKMVFERPIEVRTSIPADLVIIEKSRVKAKGRKGYSVGATERALPTKGLDPALKFGVLGPVCD